MIDYEKAFQEYKASSLFGRYVTLKDIEPLLNQLNTENQLQIVGESVLKQPIYTYTVGHGKTRILIWSQMHGNESTTTKALFDFFNFLKGGSSEAHQLLAHFTFLCLPMLNPDGAEAYTRENANQIDLNRDAQDLSQPESILLRDAFERFEPHYCFNMHDQRTIYGTGDFGKPATVSFLAPSYNQEREINEARKKAIQVIVSMNATLQKYIPNQVGRFDDGFNLNCVGDTFQYFNTPTLLFEAGHFQGDYDREETRKFIFIALLSGLQDIYENVVVNNKIEDYLNISQNKVCFYDFVYKNVKINYDGNKKNTNFALQYSEELIDNQVSFVAYFVAIDDVEGCFGHYEFDAQGALYADDEDNIPQVGQKADFYLGENIQVVNGAFKI